MFLGGRLDVAHQVGSDRVGHEEALALQCPPLADGDGFEDGHAMSVGRYLHQVYILYYENKFLTIKIFLAL